uniref:Uncharacterized protein n=1 Tax=Cacopsylla melanoneura TaxID=428564 RepID=A0A8D8VLM7_9HEMI
MRLSWRTNARKPKAAPGTCLTSRVSSVTRNWGVGVTSCETAGPTVWFVSMRTLPRRATLAENRYELIKVKCHTKDSTGTQRMRVSRALPALSPCWAVPSFLGPV